MTASESSEFRDLQSLALHGAIADKLAADPSLLAVARASLERFVVPGTLHPDSRPRRGAGREGRTSSYWLS